MSTPTTTTSLDQLTGEYSLDPTHSRIGFVARHMVTKVRGSFNDFEGTLDLDGSDPSRSSGKVVVKAASIDTRNADRDGHLRSNDFFDMENHPEIVFESRSVEPVGDETFRVSGDLTIKGTTLPIHIDFEYTGSGVDPFGNSRVGLEGFVVINRKDWGVNWNAPLEAGGFLVGDKITLEFEISAVRKP